MAVMAATLVMETAREIATAFNEGDRQAFRSRLAGDCEYWEPATGRRIQGADAVTDTCFGWKVTWPDLHGATERMSPIEDGVVWETVWEGTATGPFTTPDGRTLPPSGKPIRNPGCMIVIVRNGKVSEMRHYFDLLTALRSAGAVPD